MPAVQWAEDAHVVAPPSDVRTHEEPTPTGVSLDEARETEGVVPSMPAAEADAGSTAAAPAADAVPVAQPEHWVASEDAAEWNSLLTWARLQRGPQWDTGTGMYVPRLTQMASSARKRAVLWVRQK